MQFTHKNDIDAADFDDTFTQIQWYHLEHVSQLIHFWAFKWEHLACSQGEAAWWNVIVTYFTKESLPLCILQVLLHAYFKCY